MAPSVAPLQGHFDGGEVSPLLYGRVDSERYKSSLALCKNWIPTIQGGLTRRPGTYFINKTAGSSARLIPFEFSTTQAYILEFGLGYIRFYADYGQIQSGGGPYEVTTPYTDVSRLRYTQSADVLYLVHPDHPPMKLERFGQTNWQLVQISFIDGPYRSINTSQVTATAAATTGSNVNVTLGPQQSVENCADNGVGLIRVTITAHGWETGQPIFIGGVVGTTEANGDWIITVVDADNFDLQGSTFVNAYVSDGTLQPTGTANPAVKFDSFAIGTPLRLEVGGTWGWGYVVGYATPGVLSVNIQSAFGGTSATKSWSLGLWQQGPVNNNYPSTVAFHEDRLGFSGTPSEPQRIDLSRTADYENFSPSEPDGSVVDSDALDFSLNANDVNLVQWLNSDEKGLLAGSVSAEWVMRPSLSAEALTPTNVSAKRSTKWGSAAINSVQVGKSTLYVQRGGRKLREFMYYFDIDGYRSTDLTELAEHITGSGVIDMTYQSIPISVVWLVRNDGALLGMTYDRDMAQLRVGWHWHFLGGQSDAAGTPPIITSVATIPNPDGTRDDVWMVVQRWINGAAVFSIEYMTKIFEDIDRQENAFFLDCGLTLNNPLSMEAATQANPIVISSTAHGLSNGNTVLIDNVVGMSQLNKNVYTVAAATTDTFELKDSNGNFIDSTTFCPYVSGGKIWKRVTTISGLDHLKGETVAILADGANITPQVVNGSGQITLPSPAAVVSVGYDYNSDGELLRLEAGARNGTSLGKNRRTHRIGAMLHRSQGLSLGRSFTSNLDPVQFPAQETSGAAPALFSGIVSQTSDFDYDFDNQICFRASGPLPCTILAIMPMLETQDRA